MYIDSPSTPFKPSHRQRIKGKENKNVTLQCLYINFEKKMEDKEISLLRKRNKSIKQSPNVNRKPKISPSPAQEENTTRSRRDPSKPLK